MCVNVCVFTCVQSGSCLSSTLFTNYLQPKLTTCSSQKTLVSHVFCLGQQNSHFWNACLFFTSNNLEKSIEYFTHFSKILFCMSTYLSTQTPSFCKIQLFKSTLVTLLKFVKVSSVFASLIYFCVLAPSSEPMTLSSWGMEG